MPLERPSVVRPGLFGVEAAADTRRGVFDAHNEALMARSLPIDAVFIGDSITDMWALDVFFQGASGMIVNRASAATARPSSGGASMPMSCSFIPGSSSSKSG
jgi:hypothetical protein